MRGFLALETGRVFSGRLLGPLSPAGGEVVFHTGMTGYQEILTDPSYAGQIVVFTTAHLGNYGLHDDHEESAGMHAAGMVVRDLCPRTFHARSTQDLTAAVMEAGLPILSDVDTRAVTMALREEGACRGVIGAGDPDALVARARAVRPMAATDWIAAVTSRRPRALKAASGTPRPYQVAVLDCGAKQNILRRLCALGCDLRIHPAGTPTAKLAADAEGVFLSNGPGDPATRPDLVATVQELLALDIPVFGICLGHQLLARALGGRTARLPFGHHGANHPVHDLKTGRVLITSQNHNYHVPDDSLNPRRARVTHRSLNDGSVEGLEAAGCDAYSVQFHPEAAPGPHDALPVFDRFIAMITARRARGKEAAHEASG